MAILIGNRDDVVRSTRGHAIGFKTGEETQVPDDQELIQECLTRGHSIKKATVVAPKKTEDEPIKTVSKPAVTKSAVGKAVV